ncbi:MAG TPA: hypothetical protein VHO72_00490 [Bacteroidales bacterium]|nr:hypothetical protein [Bacteroidales bacterium]
METALEHILTSTYKDEMIAYLQSHPEYFEEAAALAMSNKRLYSWRAAWLLWSCMTENDSRIRPYIKSFINSLETKPDGHQRELLKILQNMELDEEDEGILFNVCVNLWLKINSQPSVRYTAFVLMSKMADKYPELLHEVLLLTEDHYIETLSPGIKHSISRVIEKIRQ